MDKNQYFYYKNALMYKENMSLNLEFLKSTAD
jgi:hypothetical protein